MRSQWNPTVARQWSAPLGQGGLWERQNRSDLAAMGGHYAACELPDRGPDSAQTQTQRSSNVEPDCFFHQSLLTKENRRAFLCVVPGRTRGSTVSRRWRGSSGWWALRLKV